MDPERALAWAQAERERAAVVQLAADLHVVGVEILVFKGIYIAYAVAPRPDYRLCLDADVIVVGDRFEHAGARLRALARWKLHDTNWSAHGARLIETDAYVDLHRLPLPPRFGRFDLGAVRARAKQLPAQLGAAWVPDPLDAATLTVANYVKDLFGFIGHGKLAQDLSLLEEHAGVRPVPLAERMTEHGLRRVGLAAFADLAAAEPRWAAYRDAFVRTRAELGALELFAKAVPAVAHRSERLAFLGVRALPDRPTDAALSTTLAFVRLTRDALFRS